MTGIDAINFSSKFVEDLIGKPMSNEIGFLKDFIISEALIDELEPNNYEVKLVGINNKTHSRCCYYLITYLIDNNIPFNREEFGFQNIKEGE